MSGGREDRGSEQKLETKAPTLRKVVFLFNLLSVYKKIFLESSENACSGYRGVGMQDYYSKVVSLTELKFILLWHIFSPGSPTWGGQERCGVSGCPHCTGYECHVCELTE